MTKELIDLLSKNNVTYIDTLEEVRKLYDFEELLKTNQFVSNGKNNVIIFDTPIFNSCYVIDVLNEFMENNVIEANIFYCDSIEVYNTIFNEFFKIHEIKIEEGTIRPVILFFNETDINIEFEAFGPITLHIFEIVKQFFLGKTV